MIPVKPVSPMLNPAQELSNGLIGCWPTVEGSFATTSGNLNDAVRDYSHTGVHLRRFSSTPGGIDWTGSPYGWCLTRPTVGSSGGLELVDVARVALDTILNRNEGAIGLLLSFRGDNGATEALTNLIGSTANNWAVRVQWLGATNILRFRTTFGGTSVNCDGPTALTLGQWYQVVLTWSVANNLMAMYVDGALVATATGLGTPTATALGTVEIMGVSPQVAYDLAGAWLWSRVLSEFEVGLWNFDPFGMLRGWMWELSFLRAAKVYPPLILDTEEGRPKRLPSGSSFEVDGWRMFAREGNFFIRSPEGIETQLN